MSLGITYHKKWNQSDAEANFEPFFKSVEINAKWMIELCHHCCCKSIIAHNQLIQPRKFVSGIVAIIFLQITFSKKFHRRIASMENVRGIFEIADFDSWTPLSLASGFGGLQTVIQLRQGRTCRRIWWNRSIDEPCLHPQPWSVTKSPGRNRRSPSAATCTLKWSRS